MSLSKHHLAAMLEARAQGLGPEVLAELVDQPLPVESDAADPKAAAAVARMLRQMAMRPRLASKSLSETNAWTILKSNSEGKDYQGRNQSGQFGHGKEGKTDSYDHKERELQQRDLFSGVGDHGKDDEKHTDEQNPKNTSEKTSEPEKPKESEKTYPAPDGGIVINGTYYHTGEPIPHSKINDKTIEAITAKGLGGLPTWQRKSMLTHQMQLRSHLFNVMQSDLSPEIKASVKDKVFAEHRKMLEQRFSELADKFQDVLHGQLEAKVRDLLTKSDEYFRQRAAATVNMESGRRSAKYWNRDDAAKFFTKIDFHVKQELRLAKAAEESAKVQWPHGLSEQHDAAIKKLNAAIEASAAKYSGPLHGKKGEQLKHHFTKECAATISQMSPKAVGMLNSNLRKLEMVAGRTSDYPGSYKRVGGWAELGGGTMKISAGNTGTFAHESGHIIDNKLSDHPDWIEAYKTEIDLNHSPLSEYAKTEPCEGFAEFARMMWSSEHTGRKNDLSLKSEVASKFPKALAFWRKHVDGVQ